MTGFSPLEPVTSIACVYSVGSSGDVGVGTAPAVPGWVPPPPPPPPPPPVTDTLPSAFANALSSNVSLVVSFDEAVTLAGLPGWTADNGFTTKHVTGIHLDSPTLAIVDFNAPVAEDDTLTIALHDTHVRTVSGGYVTAGDYPCSDGL
jgi:hypothetical protein